MKLNIKPFIVDSSEKPKITPPTGWESPVGFWKVYTEGDCEGRTITQLGYWYGHVVEIAFYLANKSYYSLSFEPYNPDEIKPNKVTPNQVGDTATGNSVWISLGTSSKTWGMKSDKRAKWIETWLDCEDITVHDHGNNGEIYFASSFIKRKK